jgi:hypothetical protein
MGRSLNGTHNFICYGVNFYRTYLVCAMSLAKSSRIGPGQKSIITPLAMISWRKGFWCLIRITTRRALIQARKRDSKSPFTIMKFTSTLKAFICLIPLLVTEVMANYVILQVLLNNGNSFYCVDRSNNCCTSTEWNLISTKVYAMSQNQRDLEDHSTVEVLGNSTQIGNNTDMDRDLQSYPGYCKNNCNGYATGRCMALNCRGYRKSREMEEAKSSSLRPKRNLFYSTSCENQKSEMNNLLTNIQSQIGPRCKALLNAPRKMSCYSTTLCWRATHLLRKNFLQLWRTW